MFLQVTEGTGLFSDGEGTSKRRTYFKVPKVLLVSAFGDSWQQAGFKVQLYVHKDGQCIAGGCIDTPKLVGGAYTHSY
jgi:hypothetical protein